MLFRSESFQFLQMLRLRAQRGDLATEGGNRIDPYALNELDQRMLKEALRQARQLQHRLQLTYGQ